MYAGDFQALIGDPRMPDQGFAYLSAVVTTSHKAQNFVELSSRTKTIYLLYLTVRPDLPLFPRRILALGLSAY